LSSREGTYFSLTLQGEYKKLYGKQSVPCTPGTLVFHPPEQKQSGYCETGGRSFIIEIAPQVLDRFEHHSASLEKLTISRGGVLTWLAIRLYKEFRQMDEFSPLAIEGLVLEMIVEGARRSTKASCVTPPYWLKQTKEILETCYSENLRLVRIAKSVGVHPVHMATEFRRFYKSTMGEYTRRLRVDFACHEISKTQRPLSQIALAAGFSSQSHLCTAFKRVTGITPTEYRSQFRSP
jgi:AraC family transcriptional regulator